MATGLVELMKNTDEHCEPFESDEIFGDENSPVHVPRHELIERYLSILPLPRRYQPVNGHRNGYHFSANGRDFADC